MTQSNKWEDFDWDDPSFAPHHRAIMDIRRHIALATECINAMGSKAVFEAQDPESDTQRFSPAWETALLDYPDEDVEYDNTGESPTDYEGAVQYPQQRPGSMTVYFERSFEHDLLGVVKTDEDYEFKFNATSATKHSIYGQNGSFIDIDGDTEQWYVEEDDFRPGTPFIVEAESGDDATNNGFYRVKSVRNDGEFVYVIADNNDYEQQELKVIEYSNTAAVCDFGGDWFTFLGMNGNALDTHMTAGGRMSEYLEGYGDHAYLGGVRDRWWSTKDLYHRYEKTGGEVTFGPNDGRPPTGGQHSKDFNGDWVRCPNPSRLSTWDRNAHRFHVEAETDGSITGGDYQQFTALIPSWKFLCSQADPKEQVSPFYFEDTKRIHWKYGGKVGIRAEQITDAENLGPCQAVRKLGYMAGTEPNQTPVGTSSDHQYNSTYIRSGASDSLYVEDGFLPWMSGQSYASKWRDLKYNDAIQNMIELACAKQQWRWPADDDYKYNWVWLNKYDRLPDNHREYAEIKLGLADGTLTEVVDEETVNWTYWAVYETYGLDYAFIDIVNPDQDACPLMTDEIWGENGSAFELALKLTGDYDWYLDETYPYRSKLILDMAWEGQAGQNENWWNETYTTQLFNGVEVLSVADGGSDPLADAYDACFPTPVGTWRRTWPKSLGRIKPCKMCDGERDAPGGFPTAANPGDWPYAFYDVFTSNEYKDVRMVGRVVLDEPTVNNEPDDEDFYSWQETEWTVPDVEQPNRLKFTGDKTDRFQTGNIVWANVGDEYYWYYVLKVEKDETYTYITLSSDFETDDPEELNGDINLSSRHDPAFVVNGVPQYPTDRILPILNDCRSVLACLKYCALDITISKRYQYMLFPSYLGGDTLLELVAAFDAYFNTNWNDDMSTWGTASSDYWYHPANEWIDGNAGFNCRNFTYNKGAGGYDYDPGGDTGGRVYMEVCLRLSSPYYYDEDAVDIIARIKAQRKYGGDTSALTPCIIGLEDKPLLELPYSLDLPPDDEVMHLYYEWVTLVGQQQYTYFRLSPLNRHIHGFMQYDEDEYFVRYAKHDRCWVDVDGGGEIMGLFNWDKFADAIFERTRERADYRLIDMFGPDTQPPVAENEWVTPPTLYDINFEEGEYDSEYDTSPYDNADYHPQYGIRAEVVLMEDLEGNGVEYIFDFAHDEHSETADLMDKTQTDREYDEVLDLGQGAAPGDDTDGWAAVDAAINEWEATLNSKDNYSGSVPGADDNVGTPTEAVNIQLDENLPMFPIKPRVEYEKIEVTGVWYDYIWTDVPWCDENLEYRLEVLDGSDWDVLIDFGAANPAPPAGGDPGDNHFYISGAGITETSTDKYRLRYRNAFTSKTGMYSDECGLT